MANFDFVKNIVEQKLLSLHTCYIAKVLSVSGDLRTAKIQPLGKTKAYGKEAVSQSVLTDVPIANSARYVFSIRPHSQSVDYSIPTGHYGLYYGGGSLTVNTSAESEGIAIARKLRAGDLVVCVCAERNISDAKRGINSTPPVGHHSMSDSIIVANLCDE